MMVQNLIYDQNLKMDQILERLKVHKSKKVGLIMKIIEVRIKTINSEIGMFLSTRITCLTSKYDDNYCCDNVK